MAKVSLNIDEPTLQAFDNLWKTEGWESRQEAIVFLMKQSIARGFISKEKSELMKAVRGGEKA
jgi:metal-responsive CopG/Arc/MetJ family transcriptional regulator